MRDVQQELAMSLADAVIAPYPQPVPSQFALQGCCIVAHRYVRDNRLVKDNTLLSPVLCK